MATAQSFTSSAMKKDGPENCEKWASCCLKAIKYTSAKCHLEAEGHKFCPFVGEQREVQYIYFPAPPKNSSLSLSKKKYFDDGHSHTVIKFDFSGKPFLMKHKYVV